MPLSLLPGTLWKKIRIRFGVSGLASCAEPALSLPQLREEGRKKNSKAVAKTNEKYDLRFFKNHEIRAASVT